MPDSSALGMLDGPLWGETWRTLGVVRHARAKDFGLPLVVAFNRERLQSLFIRVCPGQYGVLSGTSSQHFRMPC